MFGSGPEQPPCLVAPSWKAQVEEQTIPPFLTEIFFKIWDGLPDFQERSWRFGKPRSECWNENSMHTRFGFFFLIDLCGIHQRSICIIIVYHFKNKLIALMQKYPTVPIQFLGIPSDGKGKLIDWGNEPLWKD